MNSALVMAHSPGIGAAVLIPPGVYLCLWAAGLPSGAGFVLALSNMLVLTPLTSLCCKGGSWLFIHVKLSWAEGVEVRCVCVCKCMWAGTEWCIGWFNSHSPLSLLALFVPKRLMGFSGDFWFGIFLSNMSLMQMERNTEEGDLVKINLVPYLCESVHV